MTETPKEPAVSYVHTQNFPDLLRTLNCCLLVSTYQAQRVLLFSPKESKLSMLMRKLDRPTGIALKANSLAIMAKSQVWTFEDTGEVLDENGKPRDHDICFSPRRSEVTGDIAGHEMAYINNELVIVNTRFSCLSKPSLHYSFEPFWKPHFISKLAAEDRCHLNGMAVEGDEIRYLTALAESDVKEGWRNERLTGGILIDKNANAVIARGFSMPHSPRIYQNTLFVLNSGHGELEKVDRHTGKRTSILRLPGFLRGLNFVGPYAFIGLSKVREKKTFGNLAIEDYFKELQCAIYCVDLRTAQVAGFIQFTKGIEELFDVAIIKERQKPDMIGFEEETIDGLFILPPSTTSGTVFNGR